MLWSQIQQVKIISQLISSWFCMVTHGHIDFMISIFQHSAFCVANLNALHEMTWPKIRFKGRGRGSIRIPRHWPKFWPCEPTSKAGSASKGRRVLLPMILVITLVERAGWKFLYVAKSYRRDIADTLFFLQVRVQSWHSCPSLFLAVRSITLPSPFPLLWSHEAASVAYCFLVNVHAISSQFTLQSWISMLKDVWLR